MNKNRAAFLTTIAYAEGTDHPGQKTTNKGYDVYVGGKLFDGVRHPGHVVELNHRGRIIKSTAAGRYQILKRYADHYMRELRLPDFGPASQDAIALQLVRECKALEDIDAGRIAEALVKCNSRWASLPGSQYGQRTEAMDKLLEVYRVALAAQ